MHTGQNNITLSSLHAEALARLLPILEYGEKSAAIVFSRFSRHEKLQEQARHSLRAIAEEERHHESLLENLQKSLPNTPHDSLLDAAARRFYLSQANASWSVHFARIVALDSATCVILANLCATGKPMARDVTTARVFNRIRREEAGHVRAARIFIESDTEQQKLTDALHFTRHGLVDVLKLRGAEFDCLGVNPDRLFERLLHPSPHLYGR